MGSLPWQITGEGGGSRILRYCPSRLSRSFMMGLTSGRYPCLWPGHFRGSSLLVSGRRFNFQGAVSGLPVAQAAMPASGFPNLYCRVFREVLEVTLVLASDSTTDRGVRHPVIQACFKSQQEQALGSWLLDLSSWV